MNANLLKLHQKEIARALRNRHYRLTEGGIALTQGSGLIVNGSFKHHDFKGNVEIDPNLFVSEGLIQVLNSAFAGVSAISSWYMALFSNDYTPAGTLTAATFASTAGEVTAGVTGSTRPAWDRTAASSTPSVGNTGDETVFTYAAGGPYDIYGVALLSSSVKGGTGGKLAAATRFAVSRLNQVAGDRLGIEYVIEAADGG